jgi:hypothetical protein
MPSPIIDQKASRSGFSTPTGYVIFVPIKQLIDLQRM